MKRSILLLIVLGLLALPTLAGATAVTVTSYPLWTDTGVDVSAGQLWRIKANPSDLWSWGVPWFNAAGDTSGQADQYAWDRFLEAGRHGELIGFIGDDPAPFAGTGTWGTPLYFNAGGQIIDYLLVGDDAVTADGFLFTAGATGRLWLGFNDDAVSNAVGDNGGAVRCTVNPVPEPCTMLLIGGGLLGLAGIRRKKS